MPTSPLCTGMLVIVSAGAVGSALGLGLGLGDGEGAVVGLLVGVDAGVRDAVLLVGGVQAAAEESGHQTWPLRATHSSYGGPKCIGLRAKNRPHLHFSQ